MKEREAAGKRAQASAQLRNMIEQGRSFSGRERNCCFLNLRGGRFATASAISGLDFPDDARAIAVVDWDQDGDLDLWISNRNAPRLRLMRNDAVRKHHFLTLLLQGNGISTNRDAVGARVEVVAQALNGKRLIRTLHAGQGFLAQSSNAVQIGLGAVKTIDKIIVRWPGGGPEVFQNVIVDRRYRLVQGTGRASRLESPARKLALTPANQPAVKGSGSIRVPLVTPLPMPRRFSYADFDGKERHLSLENARGPTLIVLWASWCLPCWKELKDLVKHQKAIESAGVKVVVLAVDGLGDDRSSPAAARKLCHQLKIPYVTGNARAEFVQLMTGYHHMLVALKKLLPVPTSLLVDRRGRLSFIYKGRLDVDQFLKDAKSDSPGLRERWERSAGLPGRLIDHDSLYRSLRRSEANTLCAMGNALARGSRFEDAIPHFRAALATETEFGAARQGLAQALEFTKRHDEAAVEYEKAIKHFPDRAFLHYNLGEIRSIQGRWSEAVACFGRAIEKRTDYWEAHFRRANALRKLNRNQEAIDEFRNALKINPRLEPARRALMELQRFRR